MANGNGKEMFEGWAKAKLEAMHEDIVEVKADVKGQNGRIRTNEVKIAYIFGGLGVLSIAITLVRLL